MVKTLLEQLDSLALRQRPLSRSEIIQIKIEVRKLVDRIAELEEALKEKLSQ